MFRTYLKILFCSGWLQRRRAVSPARRLLNVAQLGLRQIRPCLLAQHLFAHPHDELNFEIGPSRTVRLSRFFPVCRTVSLCGLLLHAGSSSPLAATQDPPLESGSQLTAARFPDFVSLVKATRPAVVNIAGSAKRQNAIKEGESDLTVTSLGSGFIVRSDGFVVTAYHVIRAAEAVHVRLSEKEVLGARIVTVDKEKDLAIVKIEPKTPLPTVRLGNAAETETGEWVVAIGNPFGLEKTVTAGIISAQGRVIGSGKYDTLLQTDAAVNPGNSGGPLLNLKGEVVGVNTAAISVGSNSNIGFAIPIDAVRELLARTDKK